MFTLTQPVNASYDEKRSRFICHIWPCASREEGLVHLSGLKQMHPDARHICWAYIIGGPGRAQSAGCNDDGEPGGTAGKPMLNILIQRDLSDIYCCVVRYFGGIKLGAGGLARAYAQAVSNALDQAVLIEQVAMVHATFTIGFADEERVRYWLLKHGVTEIEVKYGESVSLLFQCATNKICSLQESVGEATAGRCRIRIFDDDL